MLPDIYSEVLGLINTFASDVTGGESMAKGLVIVGILGGLVAMGRNLPKAIYEVVLGRCTVSVQFVNNWEGENKELFKIAGDFISKNQTRKYYKVFRTSISYHHKTLKFHFSVSSSSGIFFYGWVPIYYSLTEASEQGAVPESLIIRTIGRTPETILNIIDAEKNLFADHNNRRFFNWDKGDWEVISKITENPPIFLDPEIKQIIDKKVDFFKNHREWFEKRGISHKLLIILEGPPGTGKSRLGRYVADRLGWSLGTFIEPTQLTKAIRQATGRDMVVSIPDVDAVGIGKARRSLNLNLQQKKNEETVKPGIAEAGTELKEYIDKTENSSQQPGIVIPDFSISSLAEALNLFQGDLPLNNSVVVMSTNCIEEIDAAMLRPSRCDLVLTIGYMGFEQVNDFYHYYYETTESLPSSFEELSFRACDLMEAFTENAFNPEGFVRDLESKSKTY